MKIMNSKCLNLLVPNELFLAENIIIQHFSRNFFEFNYYFILKKILSFFNYFQKTSFVFLKKQI
jgi:hypothetical protein